jgi:hypothetical protein
MSARGDRPVIRTSPQPTVMSWEVSSVWMIPGAWSTTASSFTLYQDFTAGFGNGDRQSMS